MGLGLVPRPSQNRRVGKQINGQLTQGLLYQAALNPVAELDANGTVVARFIYADKGHVPAYMIKDNQTYALVSDHLGSVREVINSQNGDVLEAISSISNLSVLLNSGPLRSH